VRSLLARFDQRAVRIAAFVVAGLVAISAVAFAIVRDDDHKPTTVAVRDDSSTTSTDDLEPLAVESTTTSSSLMVESTTTSTTAKPTTTTTAAPAPIRYPTGPASPIATGHLYVLALADGIAHDIAPDAIIDQPQWSTDGRRVLYAGDNGLKSVYPDGTSPTSYSLAHIIVTPAWSTRGQMAAVVLDEATYHDYHLAVTQRTGSTKYIRSSQVGDVSGRDWSPDGSRVVFTAGGRVWVANADTTNVHAITPAGGKAYRWVAWSPDGTHIAFYEGGRVRIVNPDGSGLGDVANALETAVSWSPDSQWLVITGTDNTVGVVSAGGGVVRPLGARGVAYWSPDGNTIAVMSGHKVELVNPDGSGLRTLVALSEGDWFGHGDPWSPDSTHMLLNFGGNEGGPSEPR
jgi:Tol biopolymer transport system component